jgi:hypothetical protein
MIERMRHTWIALVACLPLAASQTWNVQLEEPTGIYRRYDEVVSAPLAKFSGKIQGFHAVDPQGRELPWQASEGVRLFPASVIPGELPVYHVTCCEKTGEFSNPIVLRRVGMRRIELGNNRFQLMIDSGAGAIVDAYSMTTGSQRVLNLTPPWKNRPLRGRLRLSNQNFAWEFCWTAGSGALY